MRHLPPTNEPEAFTRRMPKRSVLMPCGEIARILRARGEKITRAGVQHIERRALAKIRAVLEKEWAAEQGDVQEARK